MAHIAIETVYALSQKWEGLVLKACCDPYIDPTGETAQYVKLKKDYIPGLGDSVDLLVIGGRSDLVVVQTLKLLLGSWTTFFLACRKLDEDSSDAHVRAHFQLVGQVSPPSISSRDLRLLNTQSRLSQVPFSCGSEGNRIVTELRSRALPTHLFRQPVVVEVIGAGFDRPRNAQYLTLRFPRVVMIHSDQSVHDVVDFVKYQRLVQATMQVDHGLSTYGAWLCQLDNDSDDSQDEAITVSQASILQERRVSGGSQAVRRRSLEAGKPSPEVTTLWPTFGA